MNSEKEPNQKSSVDELQLPEDASDVERALFQKYCEGTLTMDEAVQARPAHPFPSVKKFHHDLINQLITRYEGYRNELEKIVAETNEHELGMINAFHLSFQDLAVFHALQQNQLSINDLPEADELQKLYDASSPEAKESIKHFYGWVRNKLAIELSQEELEAVRKKKSEPQS